MTMMMLMMLTNVMMMMMITTDAADVRFLVPLLVIQLVTHTVSSPLLLKSNRKHHPCSVRCPRRIISNLLKQEVYTKFS